MSNSLTKIKDEDYIKSMENWFKIIQLSITSSERTIENYKFSIDLKKKQLDLEEQSLIQTKEKLQKAIQEFERWKLINENEQ